MVCALVSIGEEYYNRAFGKDPHGRSAKAHVEFTKALAIFDKVITQAPVDVKYTAEAHYLGAIALYRMKRYAEAIAHHQIVVDKWPEHHMAKTSHYWIPECASTSLIRKGDVPAEEARRLIEEGFNGFIEKYPDYFLAQLSLRKLGDFYLRQSRYEDAIDSYGRLVDKDHNQLKYIYVNYCTAFENIGMNDTADEIRRVVAEAEQQE